MSKLILFIVVCFVGLAYGGSSQKQCGYPPDFPNAFPLVYYDYYHRFNLGKRVTYVCHVDDGHHGHYTYATLTCKAGRRIGFWHQDSSECFRKYSVVIAGKAGNCKIYLSLLSQTKKAQKNYGSLQSTIYII